MSISEKANDLLNKFGRAQSDFMVWDTPNNLVARDKARQEISDYIEELEAENDQLTAHSDIERQDDKWIPVSERLPEENQKILSTDGKEFYIDYYARWEGKDNPPCFYDGISWAVTHWMPLPEPPIVYGKVCDE